MATSRLVLYVWPNERNLPMPTEVNVQPTMTLAAFQEKVKRALNLHENMTKLRYWTRFVGDGARGFTSKFIDEDDELVGDIFRDGDHIVAGYE